MTETTHAGMPADLADQREEARQVFRQSLAAEMPLSGRQLGEMFGRSPRWGRDRIAEVRRELKMASAPLAGKESGEPQVSEGAEPTETVSEDGRHAALEDPRLRDVAVAFRRTLAASALARLAGERHAAPVPLGAKVAGGTFAAVAGIAALAISYAELAALAGAAGFYGWLRWLLPLTADGLLMTGLVTAWVRIRRGEPAGARPILALIVGGTATVAGNVAARHFAVGTPNAVPLWGWIPALMAGYVPVAAALAAEQALALIRAPRGEGGEDQ